MIMLQRGSESVIKLERNDWFRQLVEVSSQNICSIVNCVAGPIQAFAISIGRVEGVLQFLDTLLRAAETEYALNIGC